MSSRYANCIQLRLGKECKFMSHLIQLLLVHKLCLLVPVYDPEDVLKFTPISLPALQVT